MNIIYAENEFKGYHINSDKVMKIEQLESEKEMAYSALIKNNDYIKNLSKIKQELKQLTQDKEKLIVQVEADSKDTLSQEHEDIIKINERIKLAKQHIKYIMKKEESIKEELNKRNEELKRLERLKLNDDINFEIYSFENKQIQLKKLEQSLDKSSDTSQKEKMSETAGKMKRNKKIRLLIIYLTFIISVLALLNNKLFLVSIVLILALIITYVKSNKLKKRKIILEQLIEKTHSSQEKLKFEIGKIEQEICDILDRYKVKDLGELKDRRKTLEEQKRLSYEVTSYEKQRNDIDKQRDYLTRYYQDIKLDLEYLVEQEKEKLDKEGIYQADSQYKLICQSIWEKEFNIKEIQRKIEELQNNTRDLLTIQEEINKAKGIENDLVLNSENSLTNRISSHLNIRGNTSFPLILNDEFTNYDHERLKSTLQVLHKQSLERQVIIFTSQKREFEILNRLKLEYFLVKL